jgi:hypothetical protein
MWWREGFYITIIALIAPVVGEKGEVPKEI